MFTMWAVKPHLRCVKSPEGSHIQSGFSVRRKRGSLLHKEVIQFVIDPKELEVTDNMDLAHIFESKDSAEMMADKMNAFQKEKQKWLAQASS